MILCFSFGYIKVSKVATIDEILPEDSPFFTDLSVNRTEIRNFALNSEIGQCGLVSNENNY